MTKEQEAALDKLAQASGAAQTASVRRAEELIQKVRDLGHYPKTSKRCPAERRLAIRIRRAREAKKLSPEQEAELQALQQGSLDACAQGGDTGTAIRRRPAATNAEEDRRLSRRTDAS